jgi:hypothetical protein
MANPIEQEPTEDIDYFAFRFPRNGDDKRKKAWEERFERWWLRNYKYFLNFHSWLRSRLGAAFALTCRLDEDLVEAAVNNPDLQISRLAVEKRRLSKHHFALAIAHPKLSVFAPFDAEDIDPAEQDRYIEMQRTHGVPQEEIGGAFEEARQIIASKRVPFTVN